MCQKFSKPRIVSIDFFFFRIIQLISSPVWRTRTHLYFRYYLRAKKLQIRVTTPQGCTVDHFTFKYKIVKGESDERDPARRRAKAPRVREEKHRVAGTFLACAKSPWYNSARLSRGGICKVQMSTVDWSRVSYIGKGSVRTAGSCDCDSVPRDSRTPLNGRPETSILRPNNAPLLKAILTRESDSRALFLSARCKSGWINSDRREYIPRY